MNGIDERDLAQVSGGDGDESLLTVIAWKKRNCDVCAKKPGCRERNEIVRSVALAARDGRPFKECSRRE